MTDKVQQATETFLRLPQVKARTGLGRSTIYMRIKEGTFPKPILLGPRISAWVASEIDAWMNERIATSRA